MSVTKDEIIKASIRVLKREGAAGLSMRTLAKELDIKASSLYNHIDSRQELYEEIAEYICTFFVMPTNWSSPADFLIQSCIAYRTMLKSVQGCAPIFAESIADAGRRMEIRRAMADKCLELGVIPENIPIITNMLIGYTLSFTADEYRHSYTPASDAQINHERQFLFGLQVIIAGAESTRNQSVQA